jgi:hypothetical protein
LERFGDFDCERLASVNDANPLTLKVLKIIDRIEDALPMPTQICGGAHTIEHQGEVVGTLGRIESVLSCVNGHEGQATPFEFRE